MVSFKNYKIFFPSILVLIFCLFMTSFSRGMGESFGVFLLPLSHHFDWTRASVTSIYSIYMFFLGIGSLLSGIAFDKFGSKFNYIFGTILLSIAYGSSGYLNKLWEFYLFLGVLGGVGASMVGNDVRRSTELAGEGECAGESKSSTSKRAASNRSNVGGLWPGGWCDES